MQKFYDQDSQLTYLIFTEDDLENEETQNTYCHYISQLDLWSSDESIKTYIADGAPLGNFFVYRTRYMNNEEGEATCKHLIALDDQQIVGSALVSCGANYLQEHLNVNNKKYKDIANDHAPLICIEYIATNPQYRSRGYGARIIKGISNRKKYIFNIKNTSGIYASARTSNTPSQKAFLKNNFVVVPAKDFIHKNQNFVRLYAGKHQKLFTNEK